MWLLFALFSSALLGCYDIFKKASLRGNAFVPVLFVATVTGSVLFAVVLMLSRAGLVADGSLFYVPVISSHEHILYFIKAVLVGSSWILAYKALSQLPITIVAPIRSTGPVWTLAGALFIYGERFNGWQWIGFAIVIFSSYLFAKAGKKEGINFKSNRAIWAIADELRGAVDGWDFKNYVLGTMFYRYISENLTNYINEGEHAADEENIGGAHGRECLGKDRSQEGEQGGNPKEEQADNFTAVHGSEVSPDFLEIILGIGQLSDRHRQGEQEKEIQEHYKAEKRNKADYPVDIHKFMAEELFQIADCRQVGGAAER